VDSVLTTGEVLDLIQVTNLFPDTAFIWETPRRLYHFHGCAVQIYWFQDNGGITFGQIVSPFYTWVLYLWMKLEQNFNQNKKRENLSSV
jgi:hypothetical protein